MTGEPEHRRPLVVVVGGGISGLAATQVLAAADEGDRPGPRVALLEGARVVGGKLRLGEVAGQPVDVGAEAILNRRPEGVALARSVGLGDDIVHPETTAAGIWTAGVIRRLPPTLLGVPVDLGALRSSGIVSAEAVLRASREPELPPLDLTADRSVGEVVSGRLGSAVRDRLVEPLLGGVYAGRADRLSMHATMPALVAAVARYGGLLAAAAAAVRPSARTGGGDVPAEPVPVFAGLVGGVGRLAVETAGALEREGVEIRVAAMVRELRPSPAGWLLVVGSASDPQTVNADAVILACPAPAAGRLLAGTVPEAAAELADISYASVALVTFALRRPESDHGLAGSGFLVPPVDRRLVKAATHSSVKWRWQRGDLDLVRCSVGRFGEEADLQYGDDELAERVLADFRAATGHTGDIVDTIVTRWGGALPQYEVGHVDRVRRVRRALAAVPTLDVCGAGLDGVGIPACVASGQAAATRVLAALAGPASDRGRMDG